MTDKPGKIVLVEHNPRHARLIQGMVKEITEPEFELIQVHCLAEAIKHLSEDTFDVALLDLNLPDSQGLDTLNTVQSQVPDVPIIVVTSSYDETMALRAVHEGAQDYLVRGQIDGNVLQRVIRYAIERKKGDKGLREVTQIFNGVLSNVPIALILTDESGICTQSLGLAFRRWGLEDDQLVGMSIFETYPHAKDKIKKALGGAEVQFIDKGIYEDKPIYFQNHFFHDKMSGKGLIGISVEITDLKLAEEELRKQRDRLEEMVEKRTRELKDTQEELIRKEKLATLGQLAGGVSHELRNPLGAIKNAAYFLNMVLSEGYCGKSPEPEVKETLQILEKEVEVSERIIRSLLDFASPKLPQRQEVDVNNIIESVLSRTSIPDNIKFIERFDKALPAVMGDPDQLVQVFGNIILNAIQAITSSSPQPDAQPKSSVNTSKGGQLVVRTSAGSREEVTDSDWVTISFTDTGVGIPKENLDKLFEPLFTTKTKGIGLGMAVTKILIEAHGGTIEVQSKVGKGSTITVKLPVNIESIQVSA